jgi:hypothetical protein
VFAYDEEAHEGRLDGVLIPSVTQVLRLAGLTKMWADDNVLEAARRRGKAIHKARQLWDEGKLDVEQSASVMPWIRPWIRFRELTGFRPVMSEELLFSEKLRLFGTYDTWGYDGRDRVTVVDTKTTESLSRPGPEVGLQLSGYEELLREEYPDVFIDGRVRRLAVSLAPECEPVVDEFTKRSDRTRFLSALNVLHTRKEFLGSYEFPREA